MKIDNLRRYIDLRDSLVREKQQLDQRLTQINKALGVESAPARSTPAQSATPSQSQGPVGGGGVRRRGRRGGAGGSSLRETVLRVLGNGAMTKEEVLQKVKASGYKFSTNNPMNSLGVILYGKNPKFRNENGRFSLASGGGGGANNAGSAGGNSGGGGAFARKRRQMSPEARARIAAAQRARWAKAKGGR